MISLNPSDRSTFDNLLHISRGTVFPESFYSFLHNYVSSINELSSILNMPPTAQPVSTPTTATRPGSTITTGTGTNVGTGPDTLPSDSDHRMERLWADYESVVPYLIEDAGQESSMDIRVAYSPPPLSSKPFQDVLPVELNIPNRDSKLRCVSEGGRRAALRGVLLSWSLVDLSLTSTQMGPLLSFLL